MLTSERRVACATCYHCESSAPPCLHPAGRYSLLRYVQPTVQPPKENQPRQRKHPPKSNTLVRSPVAQNPLSANIVDKLSHLANADRSMDRRPKQPQSRNRGPLIDDAQPTFAEHPPTLKTRVCCRRSSKHPALDGKGKSKSRRAPRSARVALPIARLLGAGCCMRGAVFGGGCGMRVAGMGAMNGGGAGLPVLGVGVVAARARGERRGSRLFSSRSLMDLKVSMSCCLALGRG